MARAKYLVRAAVIAAIYAGVTYLLKPISYGPVQIRISEALTLLPILESCAVLGLFVGCLVANILGGLGPWDIYGGSLITLIAAYVTSKMKNPILGSIPPILFNAFGVSYYLSMIYNLPYWPTVLYIGVGQSISILGVGIPLFYAIKRAGLITFFEKNK